MNNKKIVIALFLILVLAILFYFSIYNNKQNNININTNEYKIGLVYLIEHPAINQGITGFKKELKVIEEKNNVKFYVTYANAFGEPKPSNESSGAMCKIKSGLS